MTTNVIYVEIMLVLQVFRAICQCCEDVPSLDVSGSGTRSESDGNRFYSLIGFTPPIVTSFIKG